MSYAAIELDIALLLSAKVNVAVQKTIRFGNRIVPKRLIPSIRLVLSAPHPVLWDV